MTFLPIVHRELRAAARRPSTYRIRWWAVVAALVVSFFALGLLSLARGGPAVGSPLFRLLSRSAFGLCLLAGVTLAASSLSDERRDGTLGLLFLTDLRGYDVVLGKFIASSLNAFYGLVALLPVMGLPLLLGGVTGGEFWRTTLALTNTLFFALAAGTCISCFNRDSRQAMTQTFAALLVLTAGVPALAGLASTLGRATSWVNQTGLSPWYPLMGASDASYARHPAAFWSPLWESHVLGWMLLGLASWALPRVWQEKRAFVAVSRRTRRPARDETRVRSRVLNQNPVAWLARSDRGVQRHAWLIVGAAGIAALAMWPVSVLSAGSGKLDGIVMYTLGFLLKMLVAFQASRFFAESRRNGSLELLLCTPLTSRDVVVGQSLGLWRAFRWPLLGFFAVLYAPLSFAVISSLLQWSFDPLLTAIGYLLPRGAYCAGLALDFLAIGLLGMGLGLTMKRPSFAPALTVLLGVILPMAPCGVGLLADLVLSAWGYGKLQQDLRRRILVER